MDQGKMCFIVDIIEVMKVIVNLYGGELSFIDNVLVAQRANIEPLMEPNFVRTLFAEDIKLSFKMLFIEIACTFRTVAGTVGRFENDDSLEGYVVPWKEQQVQEFRCPEGLCATRELANQVVSRLFQRSIGFLL